MSDWRNRLEMIVNKTKAQLHAKGVDNLEQLKGVFLVSNFSTVTFFDHFGSPPFVTFLILVSGQRPEWYSQQARVRGAHVQFGSLPCPSGT